MRHLARAALYLAPGTFAGERVAGPDEDPFTLLATALERVRPFGVAEGPVSGIDVVSVATVEPDWALPAVLGVDAPVDPVGSDASSLVRALIAAEQGAEDARLVLAVAGPDAPRGSDREGRAGPGDGAVAFLFSPGTGVSASPWIRSLPTQGSVVRLALDLRESALGEGSVGWVGDWTADPGTGRPVAIAPTADRRDRPPHAVSEGAYVPPARYRESAPSRWRFVGDRCSRCARTTFPERGACRWCGSTEGLEATELPRDNLEVLATTVIGPGGQPTEFDPQVAREGPYEVVLARLGPDSRVTLQLTDAVPGSVRVGDRVDTRLRRVYAIDADWRYARKAVPRP